MQVFSCLALSVPVGVRSDLAPTGSPHFGGGGSSWVDVCALP